MALLDETHIKILQSLNITGNISATAKELGVTQSAVSQTVKKLERQLGIHIILKTGKSLSLTTEACVLAQLGQEYLDRVQQALGNFKKEKEGFIGHIRVGTVSGFGKSWLGHSVVEFCKNHHQLTIDLMIGFTDDLIDSFKRGALDVLVLPQTDLGIQAYQKNLGQEHINMVYPAGHELFDSTDMATFMDDPKKLLELPYLFFQDHDPLFQHWFQKMMQYRVSMLKPRLIVNNFALLFDAVSQGLGFAIIPTHVIHTYMQRHGAELVRVLPEQYQVVTQSMSFITHQDMEENKKIMGFYQHIANAVSSISLL